MKQIRFIIFLLGTSLFSVSLRAAADEDPWDRRKIEAQFPGCSCQQKASAIRNGAIVAVTGGDIAKIALRLVQANAGCQTARTEIRYLGPSALVLTVLQLWAGSVLFSTWVMIPLGNYWRHYWTYDMSREALQRLLGWTDLRFRHLISMLRAISYESHQDLQTVVDVLQVNGIDPSSIREYRPSDPMLRDEEGSASDSDESDANPSQRKES